MSLFQVIMGGLALTAAASLIAILITFFQMGFKRPTPQKTVRPDYECNEYWSPQELNLRFLEIYLTNAEMATLDGHHNFNQFENVIYPIVPQWYTRNQWESEI